VTVLGLAFKENVPDLRNTRVIDIVRELRDHGLQVQVSDPIADGAEAMQEYGVELISTPNLKPADCVVLAVGHDEYVSSGWKVAMDLLGGDGGVVLDIKGVLSREDKPENIALWRL
jgi:UDP-N-acetyl-D-galactosamine dehydrogenase